MEVYIVGGAVRDKLLDNSNVPADKDYLIVGATTLDIESLVDKGFKQVGKDFPVFISPEGDEWTLARIDRKVGVGYNGFTTYSGSDVTLEEDLSRRDLTINSMAVPALSQEFPSNPIVDPYNGLEDLKNKVLRHTSEAFIEDPVRVLRIARFRAKLGKEWTIHSTTLGLIKTMVLNGDLDHLTPERVWKEMEKALYTPHPHLFFSTLMHTGMFPEYDMLEMIPQPVVHHPEVWTGIHTNMVMQEAVKAGYDAKTVFACLCHDFGKVIYYSTGKLHGHESYGVGIVKRFCEKWNIPNQYKELALLATEYHGKIHTVLGRDGQNKMTPKAIMKLFEDTKAFAHPNRFADILNVCECDARGRLGMNDITYPQKDYLIRCLEAASVARSKSKQISIPMKEVGKSGLLIKEAIRVSVIDSIRKVSKELG